MNGLMTTSHRAWASFAWVLLVLVLLRLADGGRRDELEPQVRFRKSVPELRIRMYRVMHADP